MSSQQAFTGWVLPTTSSFGGPWVQGGNSFGAIGILGTNDAFPLTFIVNGAEYGRFTTGGKFLLGSTAPVSDERLLVIGGIAASDPVGTAAFLETGAGSLASLAPAGTLRFIYDELTSDARISINGGPYTPLAVGAASPWVNAGAFIGEVNPGQAVVIGSGVQIGARQLQVLGDALFRQALDSATAFEVQDAASSAVLTVDTVNERVIVNDLRVVETGGAYIEAVDGNAAVVASAAEGRIRYNNASLSWQASVNGGPWYNLITSNTLPVVSSLPKLGNVLVVDQVNGNDLTGTVNGLPFATVEGAIAYINTFALTSVTVWILPGTYTLSAGITIPDTCSLRGMSVQTTSIQLAASNPGGTVTMITMGANTRVEDVALTLTSSDATTDLVGIALPGTTSLTAKLRTATLTLNNSGVVTGSTTNVYGILSNGNSTISYRSWTLNFTRGVTVSVFSNGGGRKRAVYCPTASVISCRDTNLYCAAPVDPLSTGSYVGVETANNSALAQLRTSTVGGGVDGSGAYTGSDVLQTAPATGGSTTNYGVYLCDGTDLINHRAGDAPFSSTAPPSLIAYSLRGNLQNLARYYWTGNQTSGDPTETFTRIEERILVYGLNINLRQAPGLGQSMTVTVRKSATGVPGSGIATTMTATISGTNTTGEYYGSSVAFERGEFISIQTTATGGASADLVMLVNIF